MKMNFYSNGAVKVPPEVFSVYQNGKANGWNSFDKMFYDWVDEKNPDGIRRLLIRDMLRQAHGSNRGNKNICYETSDGFGRIFHVGGGDKKESLYWTLFNRPKLLAEVVEEFLYNLKHNLVPMESIGGSGCIELIEFLMSLTNETDAHRLLVYHPVNQKNLSREDRIAYLFNLWAPHKKMPEWFRTKLWSDIEATVKAEIASKKDAIAKNKSINFSYENRIEIPAIQQTQEFIRNQSYATGKSFNAVVPVLWLFENELPEDAEYYGLFDVVRLSVKLEDENLALRFARRHTIAARPDEMYWFKSREGRVFLYWLRGVAEILTPGDKELFDAIGNIFKAIGDEK